MWWYAQKTIFKICGTFFVYRYYRWCVNNTVANKIGLNILNWIERIYVINIIKRLYNDYKSFQASPCVWWLTNQLSQLSWAQFSLNCTIAHTHPPTKCESSKILTTAIEATKTKMLSRLMWLGITSYHAKYYYFACNFYCWKFFYKFRFHSVVVVVRAIKIYNAELHIFHSICYLYTRFFHDILFVLFLSFAATLR